MTGISEEDRQRLLADPKQYLLDSVEKIRKEHAETCAEPAECEFNDFLDDFVKEINEL